MAYVPQKQTIDWDFPVTVADVVLGHIGRWAARINFPTEPQSVSSYFDRVQKRPALARALERERAAASALA